MKSLRVFLSKFRAYKWIGFVGGVLFLFFFLDKNIDEGDQIEQTFFLVLAYLPFKCILNYTSNYVYGNTIESINFRPLQNRTLVENMNFLSNHISNCNQHAGLDGDKRG